jgi:hypothetical protein
MSGVRPLDDPILVVAPNRAQPGILAQQPGEFAAPAARAGRPDRRPGGFTNESRKIPVEANNLLTDGLIT